MSVSAASRCGRFNVRLASPARPRHSASRNSISPPSRRSASTMTLSLVCRSRRRLHRRASAHLDGRGVELPRHLRNPRLGEIALVRRQRVTHHVPARAAEPGVGIAAVFLGGVVEIDDRRVAVDLAAAQALIEQRHARVGHLVVRPAHRRSDASGDAVQRGVGLRPAA